MREELDAGRRRVACWTIVLTALSGAGLAETLRVPADFPTIQGAIDEAANGDRVLVAPGTYVENIDFLGKAITVESEDRAATTTIDGGATGPVVVFGNGEIDDSVLRGFTITNGSGQFSEGGGIDVRQASPTIVGNRIVDNAACGEGGGINVDFGSPRIERNFIARNLVDSSPCGSAFEQGGGIALGGAAHPEIVGNVIADNVSRAAGGGISMFAAGDPVIRNNLIVDNFADDEGGGISMVNRSDALIEQNVIARNRALAAGGGVHWLVPSGARGPLLIQNTIADNRSAAGSEIFADGFDRDTELINNLIVTRGVQTALECGDFNDPNPPKLSFNNVFSESGDAYGGICADQTGVDGNISATPLFNSPSNNDFRLRGASAAVDAGDNSFAPPEDIEGTERPIDGDGDGTATVDLGAYELSSPEASLFGTARSLRAAEVVCRNETTGDQVAFSLSDGGGWDCLAAGLAVAPGDAVGVAIVGVAD